MKVRPKKHLGQHFLKDEDIAKKIVSSLSSPPFWGEKGRGVVLEIGPGKGVLTRYLLQNDSFDLSVVELDRQSVEYLNQAYPPLKDRIIFADFLRMDLQDHFSGSFAVIGNFPYNISSQILFKVLDHRDRIPEVVGMFQKEVAERMAAKPRSKTYGIISVLLQTFYNIEYLFTVNEAVFDPPPKVKSAVVRLVRNSLSTLGCNEELFVRVVKTGFNQRRKTLRNALKVFELSPEALAHRFFSQRAEELSVNEFVELTNMLDGER